MPPPSQPVPGAPPPGSDLSLNLRPSSRTTSAPSSPAKTRESLLQRVQSLTGAARDQGSSVDTKYADEEMERDNIAKSTQQTSGKMMPAQSFLYVDASGQNTSHMESPCKTECDEMAPRTFQIPANEELLPVRMTEGSVYYSPAFRLDESNVCAEAVEAILFDSLEGELILAEYQQNNFLSSTTQQKLTDVLLSRSAKSMTVAKHVQNYFVKLTDAIVKLMPNEDPSVYYIPPQSSGNDSKNPKGKLPDKWRNLTYQLRIRGILPRKKSKDKPTSSIDIPKAQTLKDAVDIHIKSLQVLREPLSQVIVHWDATFDYRKLIRSSANSLDDILVEWPILKTDLGPQLIDSEFQKLYQYHDLASKWTSFFNILYELKKASIRDSVGKDYCNMYESMLNDPPEILAGIQIQLLPYLIPPIAKIKTGSGVIVKPTIWESSEGFVIYCKTVESISQKVEFRSDRYRNWNVPVQPCIVLQGPQPCDIKAAYVSLQQQLWELDSPLRALDMAFKLYQAFNLHYPADCEQLWLVVQKIVYDITTPFDKKLTNGASILGAAVSGATRGQAFGGKDRCFTLLVIDDQNTDWSKYFRGRRLHGDYEIRVEQAEFRELSLTASEAGTTVSMAVFRNGTKVIRSFKPDFVLIRQNLRDASEDNKNLLLGLMYGGIPSINNLQAIYNFQDKPWVFAHLLGLQRRLGREGFPLIEQTYYPNHREMVSAPRYPVVVKLGHAHSGVGKARAENSQEFLDLASLAALTNNYCTAEPYIDTKYDVHVQKIGNNYKAFMRKSISGNWKSNTGSAMLEQLAVTERHRSWVDHVAQLFGGLDICAIELLVGKDGKEYIIEVNDSALSLMGDSQEEDRRHIADLVTAKMQAYCRPPAVLTKTSSRGSMSGSSQVTSPSEDRPPGPPVGPPPTAPPTAAGSHSSISSMTSGIGSMSSASAFGSTDVTAAATATTTAAIDHHQPLQRRDSQASQSSSVSSSAPSVGRRQDEPPPVPPTSRMPFHRQGSQSQATGEDTEDTMKNLRKTFAGIFGDM